MKTAIVFLADGFEELEALTPVDYLRRSHEVDVFTVAVPTATMTDPYIVCSSHKIPLIADLSFDEFKNEFAVELPDLVFCPGGMPGSANLAANKDVTAFIKKCFAAGKYVSAICAAPAVVLAKTGVLKGKKWTCYPEMEKDVEQYCGSEADVKEVLEGSTHTTEFPFVTDGTVITSRGAGTAEQFAMELVRLLAGQEISEKLRKVCVQR